MKRIVTRRNFLSLAGTAMLAGSGTFAPGKIPDSARTAKTIKILGISCSPREGKTTATAVKAALEAAQQVDARIKAELLDLGNPPRPSKSKMIST